MQAWKGRLKWLSGRTEGGSVNLFRSVGNMGGRGRGNKRNRTQRRDFRDGRPNEWKRSRAASEATPHPNSEAGWNPFVMESPAFEAFYKKQKLVPDEEWDSFIAALRKPLPTTFRINGSGQFAHEIRDQMQRDFFDQLKNGAEVDGETIEPVRALPWYPDNLAWHLNYSRMQIRKLPILERIHNFLKLENEIGSITRQEAVSMIPPLFLDVQPHHKVLDMCAAPGSKTFQLLEMIHQCVKPGELSDGMVIANDSDVQRCHLLIHQTKRMCSPNIVVTNHDAQLFPGLKDKSGRGESIPTDNTSLDTELCEESNGLFFDRILCDVPCSGDGTLRKAPDIWRKWNCGVANGLHRLQVQIAMRGVALLKTGGRLVYSTCSLNPVEDEAVVGEILRESQGSVELLDVSSELPELKRRPGLTSWLIRDRKRWLSSASKINRHRAGAVVPSMFPSGNGWDLSDLTSPTDVSTAPTVNADEEAEKKDTEEVDDDDCPPEVATLPLERCMRLLPHDQDTGGFFIAVFRKIAPYKAIPKVKEGQQKPRAPHKRSDKVTIVADAEMPISAVIETDSSDLVTKDGNEVAVEEIGTEEDLAPDEDNFTDDIEGLSTGIEPREGGEELVDTTPDTKELASGRIQRQGRWKGVDPVLFLKDEKIVESLVNFYGIKESFPLHQHLVVRSEDSTRSKRIYYVSGSVSDTIQLNFRAGEQLKITSAGLKIFERQQLKEGADPCLFRIASEGLPVLLPHMTKQIVIAPRRDFIQLLANKVVSFSHFNDPAFSAALQNLKHGCCVVALPSEGPDAATNIGASDTAVACWRGRTNVSVLITKAEANQMHQRLSFGDDEGTFTNRTSEVEVVPTAGGALPVEKAGSEAQVDDKSAEIGDLDSTGLQVGNGTESAKSDQAATAASLQATDTLPEGIVGESMPVKELDEKPQLLMGNDQIL